MKPHLDHDAGSDLPYHGRMLQTTSHALRSLGVTAPAVVIDELRARRNIERMAQKARASGVAFRPHFKTHQSVDVGRWFAETGVDRITVSSAAMAEHFAGAGWRDITLAFLLNPLEVPQLRELARKLDAAGGALGVTAASAVAMRLALELPTARIWLKIDTGYGRSGVRWDRDEELRDLAAKAAAAGRLRGLLTHAGHSYAARGAEALRAIWNETLQRMQAAREALHALPGCGDLEISVGDTPTCGTVGDFAGVDEVRPGNFVFHDLMQLAIGACGEPDLAAAIACPVVQIDRDRGRLVLHGGAVHLSKETLADERYGSIYGCLGTVRQGEGGLRADRVLREAPLVSLSQEHGIVELESADFDRLAAGLQVGDLVLVWPVHSCLSCDLHREFLTLDGRRLVR